MSSCLPLHAKCHWDSRIGNCCTGNCKQDASEEFGKCWPKFTNSTSTFHNSRSSSFNWTTFAAITTPVLIILFLFFSGFVWLYRRQRKLENVLSQKDTYLFFHGDENSALVAKGYAHENVDSFPYNKLWEISESDFTVDMNNQLGSGCYGMVLLGKVKGQDVAVKTIRNNLVQGQADTLRALMLEIKILQYIGSSDNVVSLVGCNTAKLSNGKAYIFLEYCQLGSLEKFLRKHRHSFKTLDDPETVVDLQQNVYENDIVDNASNNITSKELLLWSLQIANAIKFLASKRVIHADIATRNVLLLRKDCTKLTDFGLSRRLTDYNNYVKQHQEPLPWRWMALESLRELSFSHQSDVWALGITIWEIYTLGEVPYAGMSWSPDFVGLLTKNLRPTKPEIASDEMHGIMIDCWKPDPDTRPNPEDVHNRIQNEFKKMTTQ